MHCYHYTSDYWLLIYCKNLKFSRKSIIIMFYFCAIYVTSGQLMKCANFLTMRDNSEIRL